jgi:hypothetical protein
MKIYAREKPGHTATPPGREDSTERELIAEFSGNAWFGAREVNLSKLNDKWGTAVCTVLFPLAGYAGEPLLAALLAYKPIVAVSSCVINFYKPNSSDTENKPIHKGAHYEL